MKTKIKFMIFFIIGLLAFLIYMGLVMAISFSLFLPIIGEDNESKLFFIMFIFSFISSSYILSLYFIHPLVLMIKIINQLSTNAYDLKNLHSEIYNSKGVLKRRYFLYKEVIDNLGYLSEKLLSAEEEQAKLQQAKAKWIRGVTHDIKTPLSYILGYTSFLKNPQYEWTPHETTEFLDKIHNNAKYIEELVTSMNTALKINTSHEIIPLNCSSFNIVEFTRSLLLNLANEFPNNLSFSTSDEVINVYWDEQLIKRVLQNLIINAIRHNTEQIPIEVNISLEETDVKIEVRDFGKGMTEHQLAFLSDNLYALQTEGSQGLSIIKNIILSHKGKITCQNQPDGGVSICLYMNPTPNQTK